MIERLGSLLFVVGLGAAIVSGLGASRLVMVAVAAAVGVVALIPMRGLSAIDLLYSVIGPLSAASFVLIGIGTASLLWPDRGLDNAVGGVVLAAMVVAVAVPLYASAVAGLPVDLYRFGYAGWQLAAFGFVLLAVGLWAGAPATPIWLVVGGGLFLAGAYPSRNLFDYLVDPVALLLAVIVLARGAYLRLFA